MDDVSDCRFDAKKQLRGADLCSCFVLAALSFEESMADKILWDCHVLKSCVSAVLGEQEQDPSTTTAAGTGALCDVAVCECLEC